MKKILFLAVLLLCFSVANAQEGRHRIKEISKQRVLVDSKYDAMVPQDVKDFLAPYATKVDSIEKPIVGRTSTFLKKSDQESLLTNTIADAILWASKNVLGKKADVAIYNNGGIRSALAKGDVCFGDVAGMLPFLNYAVIMTLSGEELEEVFAQLIKMEQSCVSHGVQIVAEGKRMISATLNGKPLKKNKKYVVVTIDYLQEGNDGITALKKGKNVVGEKNSKWLSRNLFLDYCRYKMSKNQTIDSPLEGRIQYK